MEKKGEREHPGERAPREKGAVHPRCRNSRNVAALGHCLGGAAQAEEFRLIMGSAAHFIRLYLAH